MAVVISGTNNSDKITATDGLIDLLSSVNFASEVTVPSFKVGSDIQIGNAGIITATTLVGNVQGNINHTSNLLLQISGSEKFRVGTSGQLGIGGANYGTSGQVLTSGGSSSAATWSTISGTTINNNANNRVITGSGSANTLEAESNFTYDGTTLQLQSSGSGLRELLRLKNSNASAGVSGLFFNSTTSGTAFDAACVRNGVNGSGQGRLFLQTNNGSGLVTNLEVEYDGQVSIPTNSLNINDSIVHIGDTDTKIRFPSNDQISFETGGVDRGRFDNDGNFLIGTTSHGNAGTGARKLVISGPSNVGLTINSTTTSGIYRDCNIYFGYGTSTNDMAKGQLTYRSNSDYFHMSVGGTAYTLAKSFRLNSDGTVRFDSTPTATNSISLRLKSHKARAVNDNNGILFTDANDHSQAAIYVQKKSTSNGSSDLVFSTNSGQVVNTLQGIPERLRITSAGTFFVKADGTDPVNQSEAGHYASTGYNAGHALGLMVKRAIHVSDADTKGVGGMFLSHTRNVACNGTAYNMFTLHNREGTFVGDIYVGFSGNSSGAVRKYTFACVYNANNLTSVLFNRRSNNDNLTVNIVSSNTAHFFQVVPTKSGGGTERVSMTIVGAACGRNDGAGGDFYTVTYN